MMTDNLLAAAAIPYDVRELGPKRIHLFQLMHHATALRCLRAGRLLSTREMVEDPDLIILGDPRWVRRRLTEPMPHPWVGMIADAVPLTFTPRSAAAYASCGPRPSDGIERLRADDLVAAVLPFEAVTRSGVGYVFFDRLPTRSDAFASAEINAGLVPWELIRASRFGADAEPGARARYHAEILVSEALSLSVGVELAVVDQAAGDRLVADTKMMGLTRVTPLIRPNLFFGQDRRAAHAASPAP